METVIINITNDNQLDRLDSTISYEYPDVSRSRVKSLIDEGLVTVTSEEGLEIKPKASLKLKEGYTVEVKIPEAKPLDLIAEDIPLDIIYEDSDIVVINKNSSMPVHPSAGHDSGTLVNALLHHCKGHLSGIGGVERPGIVHRLDKGTSGLIVVAKNDKAHQALSEQFATKTAKREYIALCYGISKEFSGYVEENIARCPKDRKKMAVCSPSTGKEAKTYYEVIETFKNALTLFRVKLFTGRTHQIRVHLTHIGYPIVADPKYGRAKLNTLSKPISEAIKALDHQMLHAYKLELTHPTTGESLEFKTKLPEDFAEIIGLCKGN